MGLFLLFAAVCLLCLLFAFSLTLLALLLVSTGAIHRHLLPGGGVDDGNPLPLPSQRGSPTWGPRMCWRSLGRLL